MSHARTLGSGARKRGMASNSVSMVVVVVVVAVVVVMVIVAVIAAMAMIIVMAIMLVILPDLPEPGVGCRRPTHNNKGGGRAFLGP